MTESERFWTKVEKGEGCWLWIAGCFESGYGAFKRRVEGVWKQQHAHRVAWEWANGAIPAGLLVCHHCDNPRCVNPAHLFIGTPADNMADMTRKGRASSWRKLPPEEKRRRAHERMKRYVKENRQAYYAGQRRWRERNPDKVAAMIERRRLTRKAQREALRQQRCA